jgi:hypothetical protein
VEEDEEDSILSMLMLDQPKKKHPNHPESVHPTSSSTSCCSSSAVSSSAAPVFERILNGKYYHGGGVGRHRPQEQVPEVYSVYFNISYFLFRKNVIFFNKFFNE